MTSVNLLLAWLANFGVDNVWRVGAQEPIWAPRLLYILPWGVLACILAEMAGKRRLLATPAVAATLVGMYGAFVEPRGGFGLYSFGVGVTQLMAFVATVYLLMQAPDRYRCGLAAALVAEYGLTLVEFVLSRSSQMPPELGMSRLAANYGELAPAIFVVVGVIAMAAGAIWGSFKERDD